MKKITFKKIISLLMMISLIYSSVPTFASEYNNTETENTLSNHKKAIIILPGISGSRFNAREDFAASEYGFNFSQDLEYEKGDRMWEPSSNPFTLKNKLLILACEDDGAPIIEIQPEYTSLSENEELIHEKTISNNEEYGALDSYSKIVNQLYDEFGDKEYDIYYFAYDWRVNNEQTAELLEDFINREGYQDVNFVAHSMGGIVASAYIARSEENKNKVDKLITLGTPYLGAPKALYTFETGNFLNGAIKRLLTSKTFREASNNFASGYELLPTKQYFEWNDTTYIEKYTPHYWFWKKDQEKLDYQQSYDFLSDRDWSTTDDGVKPMLADATDFFDDLFDDGADLINSVNAYVIIGYGQDTIMELEAEYEDGEYQSCNDIKILNGGDGTVPVISASLANRLDEDKSFYIKSDHEALVKNQEVIDFVKNILNDNEEHGESIYDDMPLSVNEKQWWGGTKTKRIKLKVECPVDLSLLENSGEVRSMATSQYVSNPSTEKGNFYTLGKENDIKIAYLTQDDNKILLTGTDKGSMNYTASVFDAGYEIERVVFKDVPLTSDTRIYSNTDFDEGIKLNVDEDNDGEIDQIILPTNIYKGKDLEKELNNNENYYSNYGLISKNNLLSTNLASDKLYVDTNIMSNGLLSVLSSHNTMNGIFKTDKYLLNAEKQANSTTDLTDNLENILSEYIKEFIPETNVKDLDNSTVIGRTCYINNKNLTLNESLKVKNHLRYNTKTFNSEKPVILTSEQGDISIIASKDFNFNGVIYAPNGTVTITGSDVKFNGVIIANKIYITGTDTTIKNNLNLAEILK